MKMKWNESGFRPPLCTYRLNWARRTSWGWWDDWDDTVLQTQDSKFEPWRSEAEHATSRSRRLPTILTFTRGWGRNIFCFFQTAETGNRTPDSGVKGSGANHYPRAPALNVSYTLPSLSYQVHIFTRVKWRIWGLSALHQNNVPMLGGEKHHTRLKIRHQAGFETARQTAILRKFRALTIASLPPVLSDEMYWQSQWSYII